MDQPTSKQKSSESGRPRKRARKVGGNLDSIRLKRIVNALGEDTRNWSLKREWHLVTRNYYGLNYVSPNRVRAIYDYYRNHLLQPIRTWDNKSSKIVGGHISDVIRRSNLDRNNAEVRYEGSLNDIDNSGYSVKDFGNSCAVDKKSSILSEDVRLCDTGVRIDSGHCGARSDSEFAKGSGNNVRYDDQGYDHDDFISEGLLAHNDKFDDGLKITEKDKGINATYDKDHTDHQDDTALKQNGRYVTATCEQDGINEEEAKNGTIHVVIDDKEEDAKAGNEKHKYSIIYSSDEDCDDFEQGYLGSDDCSVYDEKSDGGYYLNNSHMFSNSDKLNSAIDNQVTNSSPNNFKNENKRPKKYLTSDTANSAKSSLCLSQSCLSVVCNGSKSSPDLSLRRLQNTQDDTRVYRYASEICSNMAVKLGEKFLGLQIKETNNMNGMLVQGNKSTSIYKGNSGEIKDSVSSKKKSSSEDNRRIKVRVLQTEEESGGEDFQSDVEISEVCDGPQKSGEDCDIFKNVGLSPLTVNSLSQSNLPHDGILRIDLKTQEVKEQISQAWRGLPVLNKNGYRCYGGDWTNYMTKILKKFNPYCVWCFNLNFIKKENARKKNTPYFRGKAKCTMANCTCIANIKITDELDDEMKINFSGEICHDVTAPKARRITGEVKGKIKETFSTNRLLPPSTFYRSKLGQVDHKAFQAGNLTEVGTSPRAFQTIKSKTKCERSSIAAMHENLGRLSKSIAKDDERSALSLGHKNRRFYGYVENFMITNNEIRITLPDESMVRLYHERCRKDPIYIDATGTLTEKMKQYPRILYYCFAVRHPFGGTPPLPVVEYISSNHGVDSIRSPIIALRGKEKVIFGFNINPPLIILDFSSAIIISCLIEFSKEDVREYLNRTFRIVKGDASEMDLGKSLLHICTAHIMNTTKRFVRNKYSKEKSKIKFALRVTGRLIHVRDIDECGQLVKNLKTVLLSEFTSSDLNRALQFLEDSINSFDIPETDSTERNTESKSDTHDDGNEASDKSRNEELQEADVAVKPKEDHKAIDGSMASEWEK